MNTDGSNQWRLTSTVEWEWAGSWSPDGKRIVFSQMVPNGAVQDIVTMSSDGTDHRLLTNTPQYREEGPSWSPDGSRIAYHSDRDGHYQIYIMNEDGSSQRNVPVSGANDYCPAWRPALRPPATPGPRPRIHLRRLGQQP
jgi:Tol biopolymer transport system component